MKLIAYSRGDPAGSNICRILVEEFGFRVSGETFEGHPVYQNGDVRVISTQNLFVYAERIPFEPDVCVVASRHRSESGMPTLTAHVTGNFGSADLGGMPGSLAVAPALYLRELMLGLLGKETPEEYSVSLEVTHHGPTELTFPVVFIEVGSTPREWEDARACRIAAETINDVVSKKPGDAPTAIGFGGPHYAPNFTAALKYTAFGHIAPKHAIEHVDGKMVEQMIEKTTPAPELAVLDWKGLRGVERQRIAGFLESIGMPWKKTSELK